MLQAETNSTSSLCNSPIPHEPLFALLAEAEALVDEVGSMRPAGPGSAFDTLMALADELHDRIPETPAQSFAGLIWKLTELTECLETDDQALPWAVAMARSALRDAVALNPNA